MIKTEIVCESCENHYIIVTKDEEQIQFCPFCSASLSQEETEEDE